MELFLYYISFVPHLKLKQVIFAFSLELVKEQW